MRNLVLSLLVIFSCNLSFSQVTKKDTVTRRADIKYEKKGNAVYFSAELPPLFPIAGAPPAKFTNFWEFGDGTYSKETSPKKKYKKKGDYKVNLSVTNNYDNGKPPKTRPKTVAVTEITETNFSDIASIPIADGYTIFASREPVPDEEMIVVVSYENQLNYVANGKLYLFYNEKEFKNKNFDLIEARTHFNEKEVRENDLAFAKESNHTQTYLASTSGFSIPKNILNPANENLEMTIAESKSLFNNNHILEFDNMDPGEIRNVFFTFKTTPEMLKDTSAIVKMRGVYIPDRNYKTHKKKTLEMEIVTSHDPNKMSSNAAFMNYRLVRFKTLNFKIRFQNDGEGPARMIRLESDIPDMFDKSTLEVTDMYPKCPICPKDEVVNYSCLDTIIKEKQIHFVFRNIYVPGSNQKNVMEKDSTKGFVKYTLKFAKDFHKKKTKSRTAIYFDKNDPVITNYATTRFLPGISVGAKAGYNYFPDLKDSKSYFVAATVSPFKSYRWYWQVELQNGLNNYKSETNVKDFLVTSENGNTHLQRITSNSEFENYNLEIPVLVRYNLSNYIGIGAGIQGNINVSKKESTNLIIENFEGQKDDYLMNTELANTKNSETFSDFKAGVLLDLTVGFARIGPTFGARYNMSFDKNFNYLQLYGLWKF